MSIFKNTFTKEVQDQLNIRQNALSSRSEQLIHTLNSGNAWIRMTSSVNVNGSNDLAKRYILQGGILDSKGKQRYGVGGQDSAYSNISPSGEPYRLGIRAMPGITDIDIASKSAYGSLREVKINFICWDIKQLEDLEVLYMRPGYTALVEFGRAPFIDNKGQTQTTVPYYDIINTTKPKEQIFQELFQKTKDLSGNYDAVFGFVKNYGWESRPDGGYNCHTVLISIGEILESLKVNYAPFSSRSDILLKGITGLLDDANLTDHYTKNILAGIFYEFYQLASQRSINKDNGGLYDLVDPNNNNIKYSFFVKSLGLNNDTTKDDKKISGSDDNVFVKLGSLLDILNRYVLLSDSKNGTPLVKLSTKERVYDSTNTAVEKPLLCLAYPLQISVDPSVCLIKNTFWTNAKFNINSVVNNSNNVVRFSNKDYSELIQFLFDETLLAKSPNISLIQERINKTVGTNYYDTKEFSRQFWEKRKTLHLSTLNELKLQPSILYKSEKLGTSVAASFPSNKPISDLFLDNKIFSSDELKDKVFPGALKIPNSEIRTRNKFTGKLEPGNTGDGVVLSNDVIFGTDPTEYENIKIQDQQKELSTESVKNLSFLNRLDPYFLGDDYRNELGIIENYYINLQFLYSLALDQGLTSVDKKDKNDLHLYDFLKSILQGIQNSTGNVNNFDIHIDPIDNIARIIDINYVDEIKRIDAFNNAFIIELQGSKTTARNYEIKSQIFPEQSTIIAVSAQAGGGQLGMDNNTMVAFQRNLTDRIIPVRDSPTIDNTNVSESAGQKIETLNNSLEKLYQYFGDLSSGFWGKAQFDLNNVGVYENSLKDIIAFFKGLTKSDSKNRNIIPTKLTLEIDGIGGLVIGHLFRIPLDLLPKGYKGDEFGSKIAYIVTGINHKVTNDWTTSIESQIIILDEPFGENNLFDVIFVDPANNKPVINLNTNNQGIVLPVKRPTVQDYQTKYDSAIVKPEKVSQIDHIVDKIVASKSRYVTISQLSGGNTPWHVIGIIHYNECNLSFSHHLHNGDPLSAKTVRVPAGRIPGLNAPYKFEDSAVDALKLTGFTTKNLSTIPNQLKALEEYNGLGYLSKGTNSPYVWSFTNQYTSGKFVADHIYSSTAVSDQTGAAAIMKRMQAKGVI